MQMTLKDPLFRNDVLVDADGSTHRLLHLDVADIPGTDESVGVAWLITLKSKHALPYRITLDELRSRFALHRATTDAPAPAPAPAKSTVGTAALPALARNPSKASLELSERAYGRIAPLVDNLAIFEPSTRNALLHARWKEGGTGAPNTLIKDLRRWWQHGQTRDALLGSYLSCGRPDVPGTAKRGRRSKQNQPPYQLKEADLANMREALETYYFEKDRPRTLTDTLRELHATKYSYLDGNGNKHLLPLSECPSLRQLRRYLHKNYPLEEQQVRRKGAKRAALEDRSTQGSIQIECHGAGHMYEFDATIVDVLLVSSVDRAAIVGKPTLYLIIDRHSRLIVGYYIGFENASYSAAMQAILSLGEDKEAMCRRMGISFDPADWPAQGVLPEMFLADQGELMHKQARRIARSLRSTISNVPGLRPDWKPLVECGFRMLHQIIAADTPAYSPDAEAKKRRAVNRDREVSLNLEEFTRIITMAIIAHNKTMQTGYPLTVAQVADGVAPIPRELWAHSIRRRMGVLDRMDFEKVRQELIPRGKATVTQDGIVFEKMHYSCPEVESRGWLVEGRRGRKQVDIAFDYRLVNEIIVYSPDNSGESFVASLTKDSGQFKGMSFADAKRHFEAVEELTRDAADVKRDARFDFREATKGIIDAANAEAAVAIKGKSRSSRSKDTAEARAQELKSEREQSAGVLPPSPNFPASPTIAPVSAPALPTNVIPLNRPSAATVVADAPASTPGQASPDDSGLTLLQRMALYGNRIAK